jgi:hypothetical protein
VAKETVPVEKVSLDTETVRRNARVIAARQVLSQGWRPGPRMRQAGLMIIDVARIAGTAASAARW